MPHNAPAANLLPALRDPHIRAVKTPNTNTTPITYPESIRTLEKTQVYGALVFAFHDPFHTITYHIYI